MEWHIHALHIYAKHVYAWTPAVRPLPGLYVPRIIYTGASKATQQTSPACTSTPPAPSQARSRSLATAPSPATRGGHLPGTDTGAWNMCMLTLVALRQWCRCRWGPGPGDAYIPLSAVIRPPSSFKTLYTVRLAPPTSPRGIRHSLNELDDTRRRWL